MLAEHSRQSGARGWERRRWPESNPRTQPGRTVTGLAARAGMTGDDIERIEEGSTELTVPLFRRLAA